MRENGARGAIIKRTTRGLITEPNGGNVIGINQKAELWVITQSRMQLWVFICIPFGASKKLLWHNGDSKRQAALPSNSIHHQSYQLGRLKHRWRGGNVFRCRRTAKLVNFHRYDRITWSRWRIINTCNLQSSEIVALHMLISWFEMRWQDAPSVLLTQVIRTANWAEHKHQQKKWMFTFNNLVNAAWNKQRQATSKWLSRWNVAMLWGFWRFMTQKTK